MSYFANNHLSHFMACSCAGQFGLDLIACTEFDGKKQQLKSSSFCSDESSPLVAWFQDPQYCLLPDVTAAFSLDFEAKSELPRTFSPATSACSLSYRLDHQEDANLCTWKWGRIVTEVARLNVCRFSYLLIGQL